jgi:magnesium chelatase family protein
MTVATTYSSAELGIDAPLVIVKAEVSSGLPKTLIVGLAETAVRERKDRAKAAITTSEFEYPSIRITLNLAPADLPNFIGRYDLAIAVTILAASNQIPSECIDSYELPGVLSLTGALRTLRKILPIALRNKSQARRLI